eukprot:scaffold172647_cov22-Prasinocladus_malaysianus.AAC.2
MMIDIEIMSSAKALKLRLIQISAFARGIKAAYIQISGPTKLQCPPDKGRPSGPRRDNAIRKALGTQFNLTWRSHISRLNVILAFGS